MWEQIHIPEVQVCFCNRQLIIVTIYLHITVFPNVFFVNIYYWNGHWPFLPCRASWSMITTPSSSKHKLNSERWNCIYIYNSLVTEMTKPNRTEYMWCFLLQACFIWFVVSATRVRNNNKRSSLMTHPLDPQSPRGLQSPVSPCRRRPETEEKLLWNRVRGGCSWLHWNISQLRWNVAPKHTYISAGIVLKNKCWIRCAGVRLSRAEYVQTITDWCVYWF